MTLGKNRTDGFTASPLISIYYHHAGPFPRKGDGARRPNAARRPGHDGNSLVQFHDYGNYVWPPQPVKRRFPWVNKFNLLDSFSAAV
jgi:hypothetical protein